MFSVITCTKKQVKSKYDLYHEAYTRVLERYKENPQQELKPLFLKLMYLGVKTVIYKKEPKTQSREELEWDFKHVDVIRTMLANLTPKEFVNMFPIIKDYDGSRWQIKDYFYTRDYVSRFNQNEPIGTEIDNFLWEYHNRDISLFVVRMMGAASDLRKLDTGKGIMEEFCEEHGIKTFSTYTDDKGRYYLYDKETGKTTRVKRRVRHLKVVKKG